MAKPAVKPNATKKAPLAIEHVAPSALAPAPYNPRTMTDEARARLRRGIEAFGLVDPIIARRADGLVIGGHQRLHAAGELGMETVPVVYLDGITDDHAAALNVLLNNPSAQGAWDMGRLSELLSELDGHGFDATLTGFDTDALEGMLGWAPPIVDPADAFGALPDGGKSPFEQMTFTVTADQADVIREAMEAAKSAGPFVDMGNENSNGNALARVAEVALGGLR